MNNSTHAKLPEDCFDLPPSLDRALKTESAGAPVETVAAPTATLVPVLAPEAIAEPHAPAGPLAHPDRMVELISEIHVGKRRRPLNEVAVANITNSVRELGGIQNGITLRKGSVVVDGVTHDGVPILVAGLHRLEAARRLGHAEIPCRYVYCDEIDAELIEITENLHRNDLNALERAAQVAEWDRLIAKRREVRQSAQLAQIESKREDGRGHRQQGGDSDAARTLGITRDEVRRAKRLDAIPDAAKEAAKKAGLAANQSALLEISKNSQRAAGREGRGDSG